MKGSKTLGTFNLEPLTKTKLFQRRGRRSKVNPFILSLTRPGKDFLLDTSKSEMLSKIRTFENAISSLCDYTSTQGCPICPRQKTFTYHSKVWIAHGRLHYCTTFKHLVLVQERCAYIVLMLLEQSNMAMTRHSCITSITSPSPCLVFLPPTTQSRYEARCC